MKRSLTALVVLLVALAGCTSAADPTGSTGAATPTIGLTYIPNVQFSPFYVAESTGAYAKAGVQPTLRHHGVSEGLFEALVSGQEQFVVAGGDELMQARSQGMDLVAVSSYYRSYPVEIMVAASSSITTLADLKGHSIGLPKFGENWFALLVALKSAGLTEADVQIKDIGFTQQAALSTGKVDAVVGFSNNDGVQFKLGGFAIRSLPIADGEVPLVGASLITTNTYAKERPEVVRSVVAGTLAGINSVVADQDLAVQAAVKYVPDLTTDAGAKAAKATLTATVKLWASPGGSADGSMSSQQWSAMADFMVQHKLTATRQDPSAAMSLAFL